MLVIATISLWIAAVKYNTRMRRWAADLQAGCSLGDICMLLSGVETSSAFLFYSVDRLAVVKAILRMIQYMA